MIHAVNNNLRNVAIKKICNIYIYIYICIYIYIYIYVQSWKQCALPVITTSCATSCTTPCTSCAQVHELPQSFHDCIYMCPSWYIYIYIRGHKWSMTHRLLKSHRSKMGIYICNHESNVPSHPPGYHHNGFVATDALGHMMYMMWYMMWHMMWW